MAKTFICLREPKPGFRSAYRSEIAVVAANSKADALRQFNNLYKVELGVDRWYRVVKVEELQFDKRYYI